MENKLIQINLNQTVSRFELAEIKRKEPMDYIWFILFCIYFNFII